MLFEDVFALYANGLLYNNSLNNLDWCKTKGLDELAKPFRVELRLDNTQKNVSIHTRLLKPDGVILDEYDILKDADALRCLLKLHGYLIWHDNMKTIELSYPIDYIKQLLVENFEKASLLFNKTNTLTLDGLVTK